MFNARKKRRRFASGATQINPARIARSGCESLEFRQMLTGIAVAPDVSATSVADDFGQVDDVFVEMGSDPVVMNDLDNSTDRLIVSNIGSSGEDGVFLDDTGVGGTTGSDAETDAAASTAVLPLPPVVPTGLGRDLTRGEAQTVARAHELYNSITQLRTDKHDCEQLVARLEAEVAAAKSALDQAQANQQAAQAAYDQAVKDANAANDELNDLQDQLKKLKSDLKEATRARNGFAAAVSAAGRLSRQAARRGNQAEADGFARQVQPNAEAYQQKVVEIRALNNKIKALKQKIKAAKQLARNSKAVKSANKALTAAKKQTAAAQKNYDAAVRRLDEARRKCEKICETLMTQEAEYLGENGEGGVHDAATQAIGTAEQRQQDRMEQEAADRQEKADAAEAAQLRQSNQIQHVDLKVPSGVNKHDISAKDITRLIWQQEGIRIPSDPNNGNQLALAAAVKSFEAKALNDGVTQIATVLFQAAFDQLKNIIPALGVLEKLAQTVNGFEAFVEDFRNGDLKVQRDSWSPKWGTVTTTTVYNCRTCQYITTTTVTFSKKKVKTRAGGAGRSGILVPRHLRGKTFTVTHFGTVR